MRVELYQKVAERYSQRFSQHMNDSSLGESFRDSWGDIIKDLVNSAALIETAATPEEQMQRKHNFVRFLKHDKYCYSAFQGSKWLLNRAEFGFRGTSSESYQTQLIQSKEKFGREGLYSANCRKQTSLTLNMLTALSYAGIAVEKSTLYTPDKSTNPIIQIIDLRKYKRVLKVGLEAGFGDELEIEGPIDVNDIQLLDERHIRKIKDYLTRMPDGRIAGQRGILTERAYLMRLRKMLRQKISSSS